LLIHDKNDMPNSMPANAGTDTKAFVGFFLFWAFSLIAIWFPVHQIKVLFTVKAYFVPVAGVAFFIWSIKKAGGVGPIVHQPGTAAGSHLAWGMIKGTMSSIANFATLIVVRSTMPMDDERLTPCRTALISAALRESQVMRIILR
jgi:nucleobase:cation symporter-1, NCS1 family